MIHSIHYDAGHGNIAKMEVSLAQKPELVNLRDDGDTPLMHAVIRGQEQAVKFLIEKKAALLIQNKYGKNPLHVLVTELFFDDKVVSNEVLLNIAKRLILANPEILDQCEDNEWSQTPLTLASIKAKVQRKPEIERMFLDVVRECVPNHPSVAPIEEEQTLVDSNPLQELRHRNVLTTTTRVVEQLITAQSPHILKEPNQPELKRSSWLSWILPIKREKDQQREPLLIPSMRSKSPSVEAY